MEAIRVLIVDDVPKVRADVGALLKLQGGIEVAGEAANGLEAVEQIQKLRPEVVLMDLEMPLLDGYEATRQIKAVYPACRVVALTVHGYPAARQKARQAGVDDFVEKGAPLDELVLAIFHPVVSTPSEGTASETNEDNSNTSLQN
jgi:DNA-binding NarL/FixJ family response regulator